MAEYPLRNPLIARQGVVATSHPLASEAGLWALRRGGNAIDAAVTAAAVLAVVEPMNSQVGGDVFFLYREAASGRVRALNSSGVAPARAELGAFPAGRVPASGWLAVAVPGAVDAWATALAELGTLTLAEALQPAIEYAEQGFGVSHRLADFSRDNVGLLRRDEAAAAQFLPNGEVPKPGQVLRQPGLANTLKAIAEGGRDAFYEGPIAHEIVRASQAKGGLLSLADLAAHRAELLEPIKVPYRDCVVYGQPPVSQGHVLLEMLGILDGFDLRSLGHLSPETIHLQIEAKRIAFADRDARAGDPRRTGFDVWKLLSPAFLAERRRQISPERSLTTIPPVPAGAGGDTTYLLAADAAGNLVSFIQSVFSAFGAGVVAGKTGVLMNNRMSGFAVDPAHPNVVEPGKRTVHTLNTYLVERDGRPLLVGGTPGAHHQVQINLQLISNVIDFGCNVAAAQEAPRWVHADESGVEIECRVPQKVLDGLARKGHRVQPLPHWGGAGRAMLLQVDESSGSYLAAGDPRVDGGPVGY